MLSLFNELTIGVSLEINIHSFVSSSLRIFRICSSTSLPFDIQLGVLVPDILTLENIAAVRRTEQSQVEPVTILCGSLSNCFRRCCTTTTAIRYLSARDFNNPMSL